MDDPHEFPREISRGIYLQALTWQITLKLKKWQWFLFTARSNRWNAENYFWFVGDLLECLDQPFRILPQDSYHRMPIARTEKLTSSHCVAFSNLRKSSRSRLRSQRRLLLHPWYQDLWNISPIKKSLRFLAGLNLDQPHIPIPQAFNTQPETSSWMRVTQVPLARSWWHCVQQCCETGKPLKLRWDRCCWKLKQQNFTAICRLTWPDITPIWLDKSMGTWSNYLRMLWILCPKQV